MQVQYSQVFQAHEVYYLKKLYWYDPHIFHETHRSGSRAGQ